MSPSRSSLPASTCCMTAVQVNSFEIEAGPEQRLLGGNRNALFDVGESIAAREQHCIVLDDRDRRAGDVAHRHGRGQHAVEECRGIRGGERHGISARGASANALHDGQSGNDDATEVGCSCRNPLFTSFGFGALRRPIERQQQRA